MTITINHPQSGRFHGHNRLVAAALGVALVVSLAVAVQVKTSESATEPTSDVAANDEFDLDQARAAETARLVAINEIPWNPAASGVAPQDDTSDRAFFLAINDAGEPSTSGATTADGDLAFFLSINDVDG